ncbi:MAG: hypothetical protein ACFFDT_09415 [Candidatus Hodarchaeota archaeon]
MQFSDGATSRANSVLPLHYFGKSLEENINLVEKKYQIHNLPPKFMLHDYYAPSELKTKLMALNYEVDPIVDIMGNRIEDLRMIPSSTEFNYQHLPNRSNEWSETFFRLASNRYKEEQRGILKIMDRIILPQK